MKTTTHNIHRIEYLLTLFQMSEEEFLSRISEGLKHPITREQIWADEIRISHLKRISKLFDKGISFFLDPSPLPTNKESSIFFRKKDLGEELNFESKRIVQQFEENKFSIFATARLSDFQFDRRLSIYSTKDDPKQIAGIIRKILQPKFRKNSRDYLKELIKVMADQNILVLEFVEHSQKKEKVNIDGFFLKPNVIVIKRQQRYLEREIFTLIHELGHYLLEEEVAERVVYDHINDLRDISRTERWCNDFAYHFLIGDWDTKLMSIHFENETTPLHSPDIDLISSNTHLSKTALLTRLRILDRIDADQYFSFKQQIENAIKRREEEEKRKREWEKEMGIPSWGRMPVPIQSPLLISAYQKAYLEGVINEYEFCKKLKIPAEKFEEYIYESSD